VDQVEQSRAPRGCSCDILFGKHAGAAPVDTNLTTDEFRCFRCRRKMKVARQSTGLYATSFSNTESSLIMHHSSTDSALRLSTDRRWSFTLT
jgi:hypothetical protein